MTDGCKHETVRDDCFNAHTRTYWQRQDDGTYEPDATEVRSEEDDTYTCVECEQEVSLESRDDGVRLAEEHEVTV